MQKHVQKVSDNGGGAVYGMGVVGALVYYLTHATSFQSVVVGIVKALFWPAFFVYKLIETLQF